MVCVLLTGSVNQAVMWHQPNVLEDSKLLIFAALCFSAGNKTTEVQRSLSSPLEDILEFSQTHTLTKTHTDKVESPQIKLEKCRKRKFVHPP